MRRAEELVYGGDDAAADRSVARRELERLLRLDASLGPLAQQLDDARALLDDVAGQLGHYADRLEGDPERLAWIDDRLALVRRLCRKHGGDPAAVIAKGDELRAELDGLTGRDAPARAAARARLEAEATALAARLTAARREAAGVLEREVGAALAELGMGAARLAIVVEPRALGPTGCDHVELMLAANRGEDARPLAKIASGGELSRIMLALKLALRRADEVATYVFDEVDTGIGGATAQAVGAQIRAVGDHRQVLCVTHLPQIAAFADHHLHVEKAEVAGRTETHVRPLGAAARKDELARMLGGHATAQGARPRRRAARRGRARRHRARTRPAPRTHRPTRSRSSTARDRRPHHARVWPRPPQRPPPRPGAGLASCVHIPDAMPHPRALVPFLLVVALAAGCATDEPGVCLEAACLGDALPEVTFENPTDVPRTEWARVAVPFARGAVGDAALVADVAVDGALGELVPLKWHYDEATGARHSLAIGLVRVPVTLAPRERRVVTPRLAPGGLPAHQLGSRVASWLAGAPADDAWLEVELDDGAPWRAPLVSDQVVELQPSRASVTRRYRAHLERAGETHPLAVTTYLTLDAGADTGELVILLGNDTFERPVGGVVIRRATLRTRTPLTVALRAPEAHGDPAITVDGDLTSVPLVVDTELADGAALPLRLRYAVGPLDDDARAAFEAAAHLPLVGLADRAAWDEARALGPWGRVPAPRFAEAEAEGVRAGLAAGCDDAIVGTPVDNLGFINLAPPTTGAQADFTSNVPTFALQALAAGTVCPLRRPMVAVDREALRPSFYFRDRDGTLDRIRHDDYPEAFMWGGRVHYDASWNSDYPEFIARASVGPGDTHGWGAMDDQHYGNNALRTVYELTGDAYLHDLLVAHESLVIWGYLTRYAASTSAERAGRIMKEAILLYALDDDGPSAAELRRRTIAKNADTFLRLVDESVAAYGVPAIATVRDDGRVSLTTEFPGEDVSMAWQTGFHMEFQRLALVAGWDPATAETIGRAYLAAAPTAFFDPTTGEPTTYFLMRDPSHRTTGGIGETWWAGWLSLAQRLADAPGAQVVRDAYGPRLDGQLTAPAGVWWLDADAWIAP
ncbi:MAG: hypothetical protein R2939_22425 [Kofleriaceae bacterium]